MSDNKGLENTKYKLIKNEDKLILTDKKTLKARVLDVDDIDYVVDDNQRLRDPNVIENYFRLKDEPYEQKIMTKTADYVKEQKEAEKLYSQMKYEDLIDEFIKKYAMTKQEIEKLALIPDESTFKKLTSRTEDDKKAMINDFKILKKKLTENKNLGTDIFTYLKTYFDNYQYNLDLIDLYEHTNINDYIKKKVFYNDNDTYQRVLKMDNLNSLKDLRNKGIETFGNIKLNLLHNVISKFKKIKEVYDGKKDYCKLNNPPPAFASVNSLAFNLNLIPNIESDKNEGEGGGVVEDLLETFNKLKKKDDGEYQLFNDCTSIGSFDTYRQQMLDGIAELNKKGHQISDELIFLVNGIENKETYDAFRKLKNEDIKINEELNEMAENYDDESDEIVIIDKSKPIEKKEEKPIEPPKKIEEEEPKTAEELRKKHPEYFEQDVDASAKNIEDILEENKLDLSTHKAYLSIYNPIISTLLKRINRIEKINGNYTTMSDLIDKITSEGLNYFDTTVKIQIVIDLINSLKNGKYAYILKAYFWIAHGKSRNITFTKGTANIYTSGYQKQVNQTTLTSGIRTNEETHNFIAFVCVPIINIVIKSIETAGEYLKSSISSKSGNNVGYGWTDKTLTRIEKITDTLREYGSGRLNTSAGWTDKALTRIEKITDTLKEYGSGKVNPALLRVMDRTSTGLFNVSAGWTDKTLTRIEKINDSLKEYI